ncbi:MAG: universal stress protein [Steroidobacteraceae bacterium]|nr:universal stress protein [Steroidobacteraceae bacterium]MDW8260077.1 universal stress protein [Gammaproteobacteria bacterium]
MTPYRRILLVVDLTDESRVVGARACDVAQRYGARLDILHVVEFVPVEPLGETLLPAVQIEAELLERARQRLARFAADLGAADATLHVEAGSVKTEIVRVAREIGADLIVIGCRERHGVSIIVNLTEDTVLHAASCDVLAVRIGRSTA